MYTALEAPPATAGSVTSAVNDIIMANTPASSTLYSTSSTGSSFIPTNSPDTYYQRTMNSTPQPLHSLHHPSNHHHPSTQLHHLPVALSPPHSTTDSSTSVIKPSSSPIASARLLESAHRQDDTANFVSSSSLYNLDTVQTTVSPSPVTDAAVTDQILSSPSIYLQQQQQELHCGREDQAIPQDIDGMESNNSSSNIPQTLLLPPEYNNHHNPSDNTSAMESQQLSRLNHHHHDQYPLHTSHLHHGNIALDIHDNIGSQKRINNNTLVSSYANVTPSPSSDSHPESPTTPNPPSLAAGTKGKNGRHGGHEGDERDLMSPSTGCNSTIPAYHLVGSPTTTDSLGTSMMEIGVGSSHLGIAHTKTPQGKNGHFMENGSSSSLTPPNSANHLRKECASSYGVSGGGVVATSGGHLTIPSTVHLADDMMSPPGATSSVVAPFGDYNNQHHSSSLGISKRLRSNSSNISGTAADNGGMYSSSSATSSISPPSGSVTTRGISASQNNRTFEYSPSQIDCISDSLQQRGDYRMLENFLQMYSSNEHHPNTAPTNNTTGRNARTNSESVVRGMATVAYENGNYRELYQIIESRDFDPAYHEHLQRIWYEAHYKEAEGVRGRPLGKDTCCNYDIRLERLNTAIKQKGYLLYLLLWVLT